MKNYCTLAHQKHGRQRSARVWFSLIFLLCLAMTSDIIAQKKYTIGTGTDYNDQFSYPAPYGNNYYGAHHQFLIRASELLDAGTTMGYLTELAFHVQNKHNIDALTNFTIKLQQTTLSNLNAMVASSGFTLVHTNLSYQPFNGWNTHKFDNAFYWDGNSNLLVDVCFNNESTSRNASTYYTATEFNSVASYYENSSSVCGTTVSSEISASRPDMRFTVEQAMHVVSANTTQVLGLIAPGTENAPILRVKIMTQGSYAPLEAANFVFRATGTTDVKNINNARLFYSGKSDTFDPLVEMGSVTPAGQLLSFGGSQELAPGPNYFWLTYDVTPTAQLANLLDAKVVSLTVGGSPQAVNHATPAGASKVWPYCTSMAASFNGLYISNVSVGTMDNNSPGDEKNIGAVFTDYTNVPPAGLVQGKTVMVSVTRQTQSDEQDGWINVFIDWNRNGRFDDDERVFSTYAPASDGFPATYSSEIAIPSDVMIGLTGMRVVAQMNGDEFSSACGIYDQGETEDYMVNISAAATLTITGNTSFGKVGAPKHSTLQLRNISSVEPLTVSDWEVTGGGAPSYQIVAFGTADPLPSSFVLGPNEMLPVDVVFGVPGAGAGQRNATLIFNHDGINAPTSVSLRGYYSSLRAYDKEGNSLTSASAVLNIGTVETIGMTQLSENFTLTAENGPLTNFPIQITGYTITGPDAALFSLPSLPTGIVDEALIAVVFNGAGAVAGVKHAVLTIEHSAANATPLSIDLEGRVGYSFLTAPSLVNLPSVSLGQIYSGGYDNLILIPLTKQGTGDIEFYKRPLLSGSGAGRMEILSNSGKYFIRGKYTASGNVVIAGNGDITNSSNWKNASATNPVVVTSTQPWLLAVRMKAPDVHIPVGTYNADILLSDGSGDGNSNANNALTITLAGEVVNDISVLAFEPPTLMFGEVAVHMTISKTLILRNQSGVEGPVELMLTGSEDFTFENGQRAMTLTMSTTQAPVQIEIYYMPNASGDASATLTSTGVIDGSVAISGQGISPQTTEDIQYLINGIPITGTIDFGAIAVGQTGTKTITVVNNNVSPLTIDMISRSGDNATQFTLGDVLPSMEVPGNGGTATFTLSFVPTSVSSPVKNAMIMVFHSAGLPKVLNVVGTAVTTADNAQSISLSPEYYNFGAMSGSYTFTLKNTGNNPVTVNSAIVLGSSNFILVDAEESFPRTVAGNGGTTTFAITFDAENGTNGLRSGALLVAVEGVSPYPVATLRGMVGTGAQQQEGGVQAVAGYRSDASITIDGIYPNPFVQYTDIQYTLPQEMNPIIHLYNILGKEVRTMELGRQATGAHKARISADGLTDGTYYYTLEADGRKVNGVIVLTQ